MEDISNTYDNSEVVLERIGGDPPHVVLTNIPSTKNKLRRRGNTRSSQSSKIQQSPDQSPKRIPPWLWNIIAKSLGIKTRAKEKPYLSSILHLLTFGSAMRKFTFWTILICKSKKRHIIIYFTYQLILLYKPYFIHSDVRYPSIV